MDSLSDLQFTSCTSTCNFCEDFSRRPVSVSEKKKEKGTLSKTDVKHLANHVITIIGYKCNNVCIIISTYMYDNSRGELNRNVPFPQYDMWQTDRDYNLLMEPSCLISVSNCEHVTSVLCSLCLENPKDIYFPIYIPVFTFNKQLLFFIQFRWIMKLWAAVISMTIIWIQIDVWTLHYIQAVMLSLNTGLFHRRPSTHLCSFLQRQWTTELRAHC